MRELPAPATASLGPESAVDPCPQPLGEAALCLAVWCARNGLCMTRDSRLGTQVGLLFLPTGPEYKSMKSCIYIGMASDDIDVSELVETIAVTAREIEENSRVCKSNLCLILFLGFPWTTRWSHKGRSFPRRCLSIHSLPRCVKAACEPGVEQVPWQSLPSVNS